MPRPLLTLPAAAAVLTLAAAGAAQADTFCVAKPACAAQASGHPATDLASAIGAAAVHPGPDRIELGPGIFPTPASTPTVASTNDVTAIVGAGRGATTLMGGTGSQFALAVQHAGTEVSDLRVALVDGVDSRGLTLDGAGIAARRVDVVGATPTSSSEGIGIDGGATLEDVGVDLGTSSGADGVYVFGTGGAHLGGVRITAGYPLRVNSSATTTVRHARITSAFRGAYIQHADELAISDSLLVSLHGYEAVGVDGGVAPVTARISRSTLVGKVAGPLVRVNQVSAAAPAKAVLRGVAVVGTGAPFARNASAGPALLDVDRSAFGPGYTPGPGDVFGAHDLGAPTGFADAAGGDFRLLPGSPLVDAGGTDALPAGATDLAGAARAADGDGDGTAQTDIGAFEYQRPAPVVATGTPAPADGAGGPPAGAGPVAGTVTPPVAGSRLRVTRPRLGRDGRVRVRVTCIGAQACRGQVALRAVKGRRRVALGHAAFTLRAGASRTVALKLGARARTALRRGARVGVVASATGRDALGHPLAAATARAKIRR